MAREWVSLRIWALLHVRARSRRGSALGTTRPAPRPGGSVPSPPYFQNQVSLWLTPSPMPPNRTVVTLREARLGPYRAEGEVVGLCFLQDPSHTHVSLREPEGLFPPNIRILNLPVAYVNPIEDLAGGAVPVS